MGDNTTPYTTQLQAGLGLVNETKTLLELWSSGMSANQLYQVALESGRFPTVTARRLRNIVVECFAPRYLVSGGAPAAHLKRLSAAISTADLTQLMLVVYEQSQSDPWRLRASRLLVSVCRWIYPDHQ
ncbi:BrxA family protein [Propionivibrio limicola]|uniref:BrxA family protein n=1 Tax=Propionivibrio limicola TaxID=167645 RepID=UPI001B86AAB7|nr:BrxA family protein [Propionivibrio limicola]